MKTGGLGLGLLLLLVLYFCCSRLTTGVEGLIELTNDQDRLMRVYANHSLGKFSIFKASQAKKEEDYKQELEKAITFFEKYFQVFSLPPDISFLCFRGSKLEI